MRSPARWALTALTVLMGVGSAFAADDTGLMNPNRPVWILWSQHMDSAGNLWWREEAGPFTDDECRAELKRASTRPKVAPTKHYDITPKHLEELWGRAATPDKGTWISCWPAPFDFNRDLADR